MLQRIKSTIWGVLIATVVLFTLVNIHAAPDDYPAANQQSVSLSSAALGLTGPLSIDTTYSDQLGMIVTGKFLYGITPIDALMLEAAIGPKEYRYAFTWGHQLNDTQRLKLTAEHLAQKLHYDFDSGGVDKWTGQNAFGVDYQVLLMSTDWLKAVDFNAYYAKANSQDLEAIIFADDSKTNFRRIAGARSRGLSGGVSLQLWRDSLIRAAINYDEVRYNMRYQAGHDEQGFGQTISLEQRITDRIKFKLAQSHRKIYDDYEAAINWLVPTNPGHQLELGIHANHIQSKTALGNENRIGLKIAYSWGKEIEANAKYLAPTIDMIGNIVDWTRTPAVRMQQVLAVADQKTVDNSKPATDTDNTSAGMQALQQHIIEVAPGQEVSVSVGDQQIASSELQALGLTYNKANQTIEGKIPETVVKKDYPVKLIAAAAATAAAPLALRTATQAKHSNTPSQLAEANEQTLVFRVTNNPMAPIVKKSIPNFSQSIAQPTVTIHLDKNQYFTNPIDHGAMALAVSGLPSNLQATPANDVNTIFGTATIENVQHGPYTITVTANNDPSGNRNPDYNTSQTFQLTIETDKPIYNGPSQLQTTQTLPSYSFDLASHFLGQGITITVDGLPNGLTYGSGKITGAATVAGTFALAVTAKNAYGTISPPITLTVLPAPQYGGPAQLPDAKLNEGYDFNLKAEFTPANTQVSVAAASLPPGLTYSETTGMISGKATTYGNYPLTVTATANGVSIKPAISIAVQEKPSYNGPSELPEGTTTQSYKPLNFAQYFAGSNLTITVSNLPPGLTFDGATIQGTPTQAGTYPLNVLAKNNVGQVNPAVSIVIEQAPSYNGPSNLPQGAVGYAYPSAGGAGYNLKAQFTPDTANVNVSGLPAGLTYDSSSGMISGTPTQTGNVKLTVSASNGDVTINPDIYINIGTPPTYSGPTTLDPATVGVGYNYNLNSEFAPSTATVSVAGLSNGLSYDSSTGLITGKPTTGNQVQFQAKASSSGIDITENLTIPVLVPPSYNGTQLKPANEGDAYTSFPLNQAFDPSGATVDSVTGLPQGLSYDASTQVISGTPAAGTQGNYPLTVVATHDTIHKTFNQGELTLTVSAQPTPQYKGPTTIDAGMLWNNYAGHDFAPDFTPAGTTVIIESMTPDGSGLTISGSKINGGELKQVGTYTLTVKGTYGSKSTEATVTLTITKAIGRLQCQQTYTSSTICDSVRPSKCYQMQGNALGYTSFQERNITADGKLQCSYNGVVKGTLTSTTTIPTSATGSCTGSASACAVQTEYSN